MLKGITEIVAVVASVSACAVGAGQDYAVKIARPCKVGDKTALSMSLEEVSEMEGVMGGTAVPKRTVTIKAQVEADRNILAVDRSGKPTWLSCTITKWDGSIAGKSVAEVQKGMAVELKADGDKVSIRSKAGEFSDKVKRLLQTCLWDDLAASSKTSADEVFGTGGRKNVGDKWPVNAAALAKVMAETGIRADATDLIGVTVDEKDVVGSVVLQKVHDVGGLSCVHLAATFRICKFKLVETGGTTSSPPKSNLEASVTFDCPVDTSLSAGGSGSVTSKTTLEVAADMGRVTLSTTMKKEGSITSVK